MHGVHVKEVRGYNQEVSGERDKGFRVLSEQVAAVTNLFVAHLFGSNRIQIDRDAKYPRIIGQHSSTN